eukprot:scaffold69933_cov25-Tisochrysis_lutea.AAC.6
MQLHGQPRAQPSALLYGAATGGRRVVWRESCRLRPQPSEGNLAKAGDSRILSKRGVHPFREGRSGFGHMCPAKRVLAASCSCDPSRQVELVRGDR